MITPWQMKYIIMGGQGVGKSTQAKLLADGYELIHISVGEIFRWNIQSRTKLAAQIKRIMEAGELVPDEIVDDIVRRRLQEHDWNFGFILDGFPRNRAQTEFFLESYDINGVILLEAPDQMLRQRSLGRRLCSSCGLDYNLFFHRPKIETICDVCGGRLARRSDDNEAAIDKRIADYHEKTEPVVDLFRKKELVINVDGSGTIREVHKLIVKAMDMPPSKTRLSALMRNVVPASKARA